MKRTACFIAVLLQACSASQLSMPETDLKAGSAPAAVRPDPKAPKPAPAKVAPKAIAYKGIAPRVVVVSEDEKLGTALERAMFHELNRLGHITKEGNWKVVGAVEMSRVHWRLVDERGLVVTDFSQSGVTEASVLAIVPALAINLPRGP